MNLPQIDLLVHGFGSTYAAGTAIGYLAGTSTLATWYSDSAGTTPAANPYTLSVTGTATLYCHKRLKIDVKNSAGVSAPGFPIDQLAYPTFDNQTIPVSAYSSLNAAITALGGTVCTLIIDEPTPLTASVALPSNIELQFSNGGYIASGAYTLTGLKEARPEWFGNSTTDYTTAINAADAALSDGGVLLFSAKTYPAAGLIIHSKRHWRGAGKNATVIQSKSGSTVDLLRSSTYASLTGTNSLSGDYSFSIKDITFDGNKAGTTLGSGVVLYGYSFKLTDVNIRNFPANGLVTEWTTSPNSPTVDLDFEESYLDTVQVHSNNGDGILWGGSHDSIWTNVLSFRNQGTYQARVYQGGSPLVMQGCHFWGDGTDYGLYAEKRILATNCTSEGSQIANVYIGQNNSSWYGGEVFGGGALTSKGFIIASGLAGIEIVTQTRDCFSGSIEFVGTPPTTSKFIIENYQVSGIPRVGTIPTGTVMFNSSGVSGYNVNRFGSLPQVVDPVGTLRNLSAHGSVAATLTGGGSQTIDATGRDMIEVTSTVATVLYNLTSAYNGQRVTLLFRDGNTTVHHIGATGFILQGGGDWIATANDTIELKYSSNVNAWVQVGRSVN